MNSTTDLTVFAKQALDRGFHIFPLKPQSKFPATEHGFKDASNAPEQVDDWWVNSEFNIGIACGESDLCVLDFDRGDSLPEWVEKISTLKVKTARGLHVYFKGARDGVKMYDSAGMHIGEIKSRGGYVLGNGSVHPEGPIYTIVDDSPIAAAPAEIDTLLKRAADRKPPVDLYAPISTGSRNNELTRRAGKIRRSGLDEDAILRELLIINDQCCDVPLDEDEVRIIAHSIGNKPAEDWDDTDSVSTIFMNGVWINGPLRGQAVPGYVPAGVADWRDKFKSVGELEEGDVRMLIEGFLPEGTTFIGALPGEGKTLLALSIAKALTTGKDFLDRFEVPDVVPVLYLIPESGGRAFRKRCEKFHIPSDRSLFLCRTISEGVTLSLADASILEAVRMIKPVVILDTLIRFSESDDENAAMQNKRLVDDVIALRQAGAIAVIGLHHATKAMREKGMSLEAALRGTGDIAACADAVYGMLRDDSLYNQGNGNNEIDIVCLKPRDFEPPLPFRIAATRKTGSREIGMGPGIESVIDATGDFQIVQEAALQSNRDAELVRLVREDTAITVHELEKATGMGSWLVRKALNRQGWFKQRGGGPRGVQRWVQKLEPAGAMTNPEAVTVPK